MRCRMQRNTQLILVFGVLAALGALGGADAGAAGLTTLNFTFEPVSGARPAGAVNVNGARLMTVRGKTWAAATAARTAAAALQAAATEGARPDSVSVQKVKGGYAIAAGGRQVLLVDSSIAAAMKSSREALAEFWAKGIREAFASPYLALPVDSQIVPIGEERTIIVRGAWDRIKATADAQIVQAVCEGAGAPQTLSVLGVAVGETQVVLDIGTARLALPVRVMKYAGRVAETAEAMVTGRIAPAAVIKRAAAAAAYYLTQAEPGAAAAITDILVSPPNIGPGESAQVSMQVTVAGEGYLPVRAPSRVRVVNQAIDPAEASVLMVSNRPERLPSCGLWYLGRVPSGYPVRLLYHHVNATSTEAELVVELVNVADHPVRVQVVEGSGGPSRDEVFAGHKAARDFIQRQADDVGYVVGIPAGCTFAASAERVKPGHTISGVAEVRVLGAGELRLAVRLRPPAAALLSSVSEMPPERMSTWVFSEAQKRLQVRYEVGSQWAFATIGDNQVLSSSGRELLDGDYGVLYEITFEIENPTQEPAHVELAFMPGGGLARGSVMIGHEIYETRLLRYGETQRLYAVIVPAQGRRVVEVRTMPEAGSNYPVKLLLRPRGVWD